MKEEKKRQAEQKKELQEVCYVVLMNINKHLTIRTEHTCAYITLN